MSNSISTKNQEQEVLDKIVKLTETLENDSYVNIAIIPALRIAQDNISNDMLNSVSDVIKFDLTLEIKKSYEGIVTSLKDEIKSKQILISTLEFDINTLRANENILYDKNDNLFDESIILKSDVESKNLEILKLKARLYDLLNN